MTSTNYNQTLGFNYGWICPKCGSVYSPTQIECYKCSPATKYEVTSTTIAMNDYEKWKEETPYYGKDGETKRGKIESDN